VKFSFRQILASAAGAVLAALIASSFGVKGTIIGVAIGSIAATTGSALISQSIERGHKAVKQVVVRVPDGSTATLLRRLGGTGAAGAGVSAASSSGDAAAPTEVVGGPGDETTQMESAPASVDETKQVQISAATDAPATERLEASTSRVPAVPPVPPRDGGRVAGADGQPRGRKFTWQAIAGTAAVVFVLALLFVTAVELIADKPLASIFGSTGSGPTLKNLFNGSPGTQTTTTTTTTTAPTSTTTSTTGSSTNTSTSTSTTSTTPSTTTTTTTSPGLFGTTTTTTPGSATTTTTTKP
jgi:hypothetical protein